MRLDFVAVGPQKTATTWLYEVIRCSNNVSLPRGVKETFFWDLKYELGMEWYWTHFPDSDAIRGEIAPTYFHNQNAARRLRYHNSELRIIITLRDPVERAFSLYLHHKHRGRLRGGFEDSIRKFPEIIEASHYSKWIPMWIDLFGRKNILVLLQDDIKDNVMHVLSEICEFLDISISHQDTIPGLINERSKPRSYKIAAAGTTVAEWLRERRAYWVIQSAKAIGLKRFFYSGGSVSETLSMRDEQRLRKLFRDDVCYVEDLLGRDLVSWRKAIE